MKWIYISRFLTPKKQLYIFRLLANLLQDALWQPQKILKGFKSIQNCSKTNVLYFPWYFFSRIPVWGEGNRWQGGVISVVWCELVKNTRADFRIYCISVDSGQFLTGFCCSFYEFLLFFLFGVCVWVLTGSRRNAIYREQISDRIWIAYN